MVKRNHKLKREHFTTVFKKGKVLTSKHLTLTYITTNSWNEFRISVVVPKKVEKLATARNKYKRQGYYIIKTFIPDLKTPFMGIFVAKNKISTAHLPDLRKEVRQLLEKASII